MYFVTIGSDTNGTKGAQLTQSCFKSNDPIINNILTEIIQGLYYIIDVTLLDQI
jgi:hypothetical protein